ncbi:MAG: hypothetical protein H7Y04_08695 [Verrucomicrobia bacterium]|nr:hypothetical protein [Cytophagales bacterium]
MKSYIRHITSVFLLVLSLLLNSCMFIETLFASKKQVNCPSYLDYWNANQKSKGKNKKQTILTDPQVGGIVVGAGADSTSFQAVRVQKNIFGIVDKKKPKQPKKNPDPRTGYKPKNKPVDMNKHL